MSGGEHWATVEPSVNSTIEWTIDCGWTTTSIRSNGTSNSRWASMTSRPLLTRVAEFVVTTGPIRQVGWASACSGVTSARSAAGRPRNGPPLAVSTSRRTSRSAPARRHWASAECSESTGTIWPGAAAAVTSSPPMIRDSLLASASVLPGPQRRERGRQADGAGDAVEHDVRRPRGDLGHRVRAGEDLGAGWCSAARSGASAAGSSTATTRTPSSAACSASSSGCPPPAASATTRKRSGLRRITSTACVPMDPVDPSRTTSRGAPLTPPW